jgi:Domain of unknown function (DUF4260)
MYIAPAELPQLGWAAGVAMPLAIWTAHIGFDQMPGYGVKYSSGFAAIRLDATGNSRAPAP